MPTLVNPRPESVRLVLSDGSERIVGPWGLAFVPERGADNQPLHVERAEYAAPDLARLRPGSRGSAPRGAPAEKAA